MAVLNNIIPISAHIKEPSFKGEFVIAEKIKPVERATSSKNLNEQTMKSCIMKESTKRFRRNNIARKFDRMTQISSMIAKGINESSESMKLYTPSAYYLFATRKDIELERRSCSIDLRRGSFKEQRVPAFVNRMDKYIKYRKINLDCKTLIRNQEIMKECSFHPEIRKVTKQVEKRIYSQDERESIISSLKKQRAQCEMEELGITLSQEVFPPSKRTIHQSSKSCIKFINSNLCFHPQINKSFNATERTKEYLSLDPYIRLSNKNNISQLSTEINTNRKNAESKTVFDSALSLNKVGKKSKANTKNVLNSFNSQRILDSNKLRIKTQSKEKLVKNKKPTSKANKANKKTQQIKPLVKKNMTYNNDKKWSSCLDECELSEKIIEAINKFKQPVYKLNNSRTDP